VTPVQDGTSCDDGIVATTGDFCEAGVCTALRACCDGAGGCANVTPADCAARSGSLGADGSTCAAGACRVRTVFVTSTQHDGSFGGLAGGDAFCAARATAAGLTGTFKAWLSGAATTASSRLYHSAGPWYLPGGTVRVAKSWGDLVDGSIENPINRTEGGALVPCCDFFTNLVWTGTSNSGALPAGAFTCTSWSSNVATVNGEAGAANETANWSAASQGPCNTVARLYCFEQQ
jgi:hypothetical protein